VTTNVTVQGGGQVEGSGLIANLALSSNGTVKIANAATNSASAWSPGGSISFAAGSKIDVSGLSLSQVPYTLIRGSSVSGTPALVGASSSDFAVTNVNSSLIGLTPIKDSDGDGLGDYQETQLGTNPALADTDGDGASDKLEVDLGNSPTVANVYNRLINGSFEDGTIKPGPGEFLPVHQDNVPGWKTTANNEFKIELWYSGFLGSAGNDGNILAELNYLDRGILYQDVVMTVDSAVSYSFLHRARGGTESIEFRIDRLVGGPGSAVEANFFTRTVSTGTSWVRYTGTPPGTVEAGKTYRFSYISVIPASGGAGNLLDAASFEIDQDSDGLGDSVESETGVFVSAEDTGTAPLDSDSDNDGIPDGTEVLTYGTDPNRADTDGDGAEDGAELAVGTSPTNAAERPMVLSAGWNHTLFVPEPGKTALAWGVNVDGRCGLGHTNSPVVSGVEVVGEDGVTKLSNVIVVAAGGNHSLLLTRSAAGNQVWVAGTNTTGQLGLTNVATDRFRPILSGLPTNITALAAGSKHSLALSSDGKLYAWGDNLSGQIGVNSTRSTVRTPALVSNLSAVTVKAIGAGAEHSLALAADGQVYAWGRPNGGALGFAGLSPVRVPQAVTALTKPVTQMAAGDRHSLFLTADGEVYASGINSAGQLGLPASVVSTSTPTKLTFPAGTQIRRLVAGLNRAHAIATDGKVYAWGYNRYGELGLGYPSTNEPYAIFSPTEVPALFGSKEIAGGGFQTFALDPSGTLAGSGLNSGGQLGTGGTNNVTAEPAVTTEEGKLPQTITFNLPGAGFYTDTSVTLTATTDSGLVPGFTSSDPTVIFLEAGRAQFLRAGTARITATQGGDATYNAAQPVSIEVTVTDPPPLTLQLSGATGSLGVPATGTNTVAVDAGVQILGREATVLTAATVKIVSGRQTGDTLAFADYPGPLTAVYHTNSGTLRISGVTNLAGYQEALRKVVLSTTNRTVANRTITMALGAGTAFTNGHVYEFVSSAADWPTARNAAKTRKINGQTGYLANVTSADENAFLLGLLQEAGADGWLGGADITDAKFRWMDGPEAGAQFWSGNSGGSSFGSAYANWGVGEPNDFEWPTPTWSNPFAKAYDSYVMMVHSSSFVIGGFTRSTAPGKWNDAPLKTSATSSYALGYLVEYGNGEPLLFAKAKTFHAMALTWRANGDGAAVTGYTGGGGEVIIPATLEGLAVNRIDPEAFKDQGTITQITIPAGVASIGYYAFANCTNLGALFFEGDAPTLESGSGDPFAFVPADAVVYHRPAALGWTSTFGGRTTALYTSPGSSPGRWDFQTGNYAHDPASGMLILELGGLTGTTLYDQIFVQNGSATLDGIVNLMFYGTYSGPISGSWHTFDLVWAQNGIVFGDNYRLHFNETGYTVDTAVVEKDGGQLWQATVRQAGTSEEITEAAAVARPALGIGTSPGPEGRVEMTYTYQRLAGGSVLAGRYVAAGLQYEVQMSSDLRSWIPVVVEEIGAVPAGEGYENATVKVIGGGPRAFLRLKISN
jgi:alpha-tubulin suppressor-like RCC1 family protein